MRYRIRFSKSALKDLERLPSALQRRIIAKVRELAENPRSTMVKKLKNTEYYRARVGDYRILYDIQDNTLTVVVLKVRHRREVYR